MSKFNRSAKQKLIRTELASPCRAPGGFRFLFSHESLRSVANPFQEAIVAAGTGGSMPSIEPIKVSASKLVFRMTAPAGAEIPAESFVIKVFSLFSLKRRIKHRLSGRYGVDETANLILAKQKGVPVPDVYGYGYVTDGLGMVRTSAIIMEDLAPAKPVLDLLHAQPDEHQEVLGRTLPVFNSLYQAGCNHIDLNACSILLREGFPARVIDLEYAVFLEKPSTEVLMFSVGHLARSCQPTAGDNDIRAWAQTIPDQVGIADPSEKTRMLERFEYYFGLEHRLDRHQRQRLRSTSMHHASGGT